MSTKWDVRFLDLAQLVSGWSKDQSTKVGAVVVRDRRILATGYNGIARGLDDELEHRHVRPQKYEYFAHAEENALLNCAREGISTQGADIFVTHFPCARCARGIIQAGLRRVVYRDSEAIKARWSESNDISREMFREVGIKLREYPEEFR